MAGSTFAALVRLHKCIDISSVLLCYASQQHIWQPLASVSL